MSELLVLTDRRYAGDGSLSSMPDDYVANVIQEDRLVLEALMHANVNVRRVAWCDESIPWKDSLGALFRTTWDYFDRWDEFSRWLRSTSQVTELFNSAELVHWNLDKHYLHDLHERGVAVVPTAYVPRNAFVPLYDVAARRGWNQVVIKPAVAGAARDTYLVDAEGDTAILSPEAPSGRESERLWSDLVAQQDMLVQPFLPDVMASGEVSVIWLEGQVTHAVLKRAKSGDFRVQDDHGGTVERIELTPEHQRAARDIMEHTLDFCKDRGWAPPLYARIDLMRDAEGRLLLSELEMVEPELWFRFCPEAADVLAQAVKRRLQA